MRHKVYTVYDSAAQVYMLPFYLRANGEAVRAFESSINSVDHRFASSPADYTLFGVAEFDDDAGVFSTYDVFVNLGNGAQFVSRKVSNGEV